MPVKQEFEGTVSRVWSHEAENGGFNGGTLGGELEWHEVVVLRAYCKYIRQIGVPLSEAYIQQTLANNAGVTRQLVQLFINNFDPSIWSATSLSARHAAGLVIRSQIEDALTSVTNPDEDRILRLYVTLIEATLRTNYFQGEQRAAGGERTRKPYLSFKLNSQTIAELPAPRPLFEIFVYSTLMEGLHLRAGKVARGGIRWSDRREDFRTEILGLMKAQNVKNTLIVPVGAKGGFVVKRPPAGRGEDVQAEVVACYQTFIRGLLDLTDNILAGRIVPPPRLVRHDGDDPYLVVAADKGTATFSDIANAISAEYGFWLSDAFASGGSAGYDHKKMGITARGGWECVKRHFRELGIDTQKMDFTVVGVGDMSGDVFGNGMLLSRHIRLQAAFDHRHIFIDPDPDPAASFAERARLFALPRSSWDDYDRRKLSRGGGIFARTAKSIALPAEARALLGLEAT